MKIQLICKKNSATQFYLLRIKLNQLKASKEHLETASTKIPQISFMIATFGVALSLWGASWDVTSHLLRTPETFFTPSHIILYIGVGISLISAIVSLVFFIVKKQSRKSHFVFGSKLIIAGAVLQIIAGPGDFYWHELFGLDGLLSPTHITLALGVIIVSIGSLIGFTRINSHSNEKNNFLKVIIPISFGIFWFGIMWFIFFFVLPISEGDTHNFNPDPYFAIVLSFIALPFTFSIIFWSISKTLNVFGAATASAFAFMVMNITANIITSQNIIDYLPWFAAPIISGILADYVLSKKIKLNTLQKHHEKISGAILGSMFFMFCFPMLSMTFLDVYLFNDVFPYDILPTSADTVSQIWLMTIIPGAISGMFGMMVASRKLKRISRQTSNVF